MMIEITLLISLVSACFSAFSVVSNNRRGQKSVDKEEATQLTTVLIKLENIGDGVSEIKTEMRGLKEETKEIRDRLIKVEESTKQAHKRINDIGGKEKDGLSD